MKKKEVKKVVKKKKSYYVVESLHPEDYYNQQVGQEFISPIGARLIKFNFHPSMKEGYLAGAADVIIKGEKKERQLYFYAVKIKKVTIKKVSK